MLLHMGLVKVAAGQSRFRHDPVPLRAAQRQLEAQLAQRRPGIVRMFTDQYGGSLAALLATPTLARLVRVEGGGGYGSAGLADDGWQTVGVGHHGGPHIQVLLGPLLPLLPKGLLKPQQPAAVPKQPASGPAPAVQQAPPAPQPTPAPALQLAATAAAATAAVQGLLARGTGQLGMACSLGPSGSLWLLAVAAPGGIAACFNFAGDERAGVAAALKPLLESDDVVKARRPGGAHGLCVGWRPRLAALCSPPLASLPATPRPRSAPVSTGGTRLPGRLAGAVQCGRYHAGGRVGYAGGWGGWSAGWLGAWGWSDKGPQPAGLPSCPPARLLPRRAPGLPTLRWRLVWCSTSACWAARQQRRASTRPHCLSPCSPSTSWRSARLMRSRLHCSVRGDGGGRAGCGSAPACAARAPDMLPLAPSAPAATAAALLEAQLVQQTELGPTASGRVGDLSRAWSRWHLDLAALTGTARPPRQWLSHLLDLAPLAL